MVIVAATDELAGKLLDTIRLDLETNDLLFADFPEACLPIRRARNAHAAPHLTATVADEKRNQFLPPCKRHKMRLQLKGGVMQLAQIPGAKCSGGIIDPVGLTAAIRGRNVGLADGSTVRPDLVLLDDPQTTDSAMSTAQTTTREKIIASDVAGLAGPGVRLAMLATVTVIAPNDLSDRLMNRQRHPEWHTTRRRMVLSWPTRADLWDRYWQIQAGDGPDSDPDTCRAAALDHYRANRTEMDAGGSVSWPARLGPDDVSALQHAMDKAGPPGLPNRAAFMAEYQGEPPADDVTASGDRLQSAALCQRLTAIPRGTIPDGCDLLTVFVDPGTTVGVHWLALAVNRQTWLGGPVDWGRDDVPVTGDDESAVYLAVGTLCRSLTARQWTTQGGQAVQVARLAVDSGRWSTLIYRLVREMALPGVVPSKGFYVKAGSRWYPAREGSNGPPGDNWREAVLRGGGRTIRLLEYDTNRWKDHSYARLTEGMGGKSRWALPGDNGHAMEPLAAHLCAEIRTPVTRAGVTATEWTQPPGTENHWFDCLVGASVCAATQGARFTGDVSTDRPKIKLSDLQRSKRT